MSRAWTGGADPAARLAAPTLACLLAVASLSSVSPATAQEAPPEVRVPPVDEAARDPGLFALRARLMRAIGERDVETIVAAASEDVCLSFGGFVGREDFRDFLEADASDAYWGELATALALGGVFVGDSSFMAPYLTETFPRDVDLFEGLVALGPDVPARAAPQPGAEFVRELDWEVVLRDRDADPTGAGTWTAVRLPGGESAWIESRDLRSPIGYRARFARRDGRWRLVSFLAGD